MKKMQWKSKIYNIHTIAPTPPLKQGKSQAPPQIKQCGWQTPSFRLKRVARKAQGFSMQKTILPLNQGKSNQASNSTKDANSS
jgi:hypothetical protein